MVIGGYALLIGPIASLGIQMYLATRAMQSGAKTIPGALWVLYLPPPLIRLVIAGMACSVIAGGSLMLVGFWLRARGRS